MESTRVSKKVDRFEAALLELGAYDCDRITASSSASPQNDGEKERKNNDDDFNLERSRAPARAQPARLLPRRPARPLNSQFFFVLIHNSFFCLFVFVCIMY